jgi:LmbE family N-acetylglucosaminyl deacetylase
VILDHEDGMLPWVDADALQSDIRDAILRRRPDVVITFGEDGLYWHPDHIALHTATTAVVAALGADAPALYYVTMPPGRMRAVLDCVAAQGAGPSPLRILGVADADAFGALAAAPTLVVEAGAFAVRKLAAIKCHRSQVEGDALDRLSEDDAVRLLGTEHYRRASIGARGEAFIEGFAVHGVRGR